jgi:hypothetical protein
MDQGQIQQKIETPEMEHKALSEKIGEVENIFNEARARSESVEPRESIKEKIVKEALSRHLAQVSQSAAPAYKISDDAAHKCSLDISALATEAEQIEALFDIVRAKGVFNAFEVAKRMGNPHILDVFHDNFIKHHEKFLGK